MKRRVVYYDDGTRMSDVIVKEAEELLKQQERDGRDLSAEAYLKLVDASLKRSKRK